MSTGPVNSADHGERYWRAVRHKILEMDDEAPEQILSDNRIGEILRESGVDIARRTVAKYRESLRIPSSVERKRKPANRF